MNMIQKNAALGRVNDMLQGLARNCSKDDLAECIRYLAANLARYRAHYDILPVVEPQKLSSGTVDADLAMTLQDGMREAITALARIMDRPDVIEKLQRLNARAQAQAGPSSPNTSHAATGERAITHHFQSQRFFYHASVDGSDDGWYFSVRGGLVYGPFPDESSARKILQGLIEHYRHRGETGGR